jgi:Raf kinase inhibitor-like YbhB/YbcL family protein
VRGDVVYRLTGTMTRSPSGRARSGLLAATALVPVALLIAGCGVRAGGDPLPLEITSPAFGAHGEIPRRYTCEGDDVSPPLAWKGVPPGTRSLVLIVDDPDAPDPKAPQRTWVHWVLFDLPPGSDGLAEGASRDGLPEGTGVGTNDWQRRDYGGPCPPIGRHRYFHKLYALDAKLGLSAPDKAGVERAMEGHVLARAELVGTYAKRER